MRVCTATRQPWRVGADDVLLDGVLDADSLEHDGSGVVPDVEAHSVGISLSELPDEEVSVPGKGAIGRKPPEELLSGAEAVVGAEVDVCEEAEAVDVGAWVVAEEVVGAWVGAVVVPVPVEAADEDPAADDDAPDVVACAAAEVVLAPAAVEPEDAAGDAPDPPAEEAAEEPAEDEAPEPPVEALELLLGEEPEVDVSVGSAEPHTEGSNPAHAAVTACTAWSAWVCACLRPAAAWARSSASVDVAVLGVALAEADACWLG